MLHTLYPVVGNRESSYSSDDGTRRSPRSHRMNEPPAIAHVLLHCCNKSTLRLWIPHGGVPPDPKCLNFEIFELVGDGITDVVRQGWYTMVSDTSSTHTIQRSRNKQERDKKHHGARKTLARFGLGAELEAPAVLSSSRPLLEALVLPTAGFAGCFGIPTAGIAGCFGLSTAGIVG